MSRYKIERKIISTVKPTRCTNVSNLFYFGMTLHVSDGLSVHHQEFKTVHATTGICQRDTALCLLAGTSSWFYYRNNIMMHGPMNVKYRESLQF